MWDLIAFRQLGSSDFAGSLIRLNPQYVHTFIFPAGVTLRLPDLPDSSGEPLSLPPWKR